MSIPHNLFTGQLMLRQRSTTPPLWLLENGELLLIHENRMASYNPRNYMFKSLFPLSYVDDSGASISVLHMYVKLCSTRALLNRPLLASNYLIINAYLLIASVTSNAYHVSMSSRKAESRSNKQWVKKVSTKVTKFSVVAKEATQHQDRVTYTDI